MKIAVVSGKGGAGKTTFTILLSDYLTNMNKRILVADLDVEEPNVNLFFKKHLNYSDIDTYFPKHIRENCTYCKECAEKCLFNALIVAKDFWLVVPELCHSCKLCEHVCKFSAIVEDKRKIGEIGKSFEKLPHLIEGRLNIGESLATALIESVKNEIDNIKNNYDFILMDAPPGTSCPAIETCKDADRIIVVAEDTPFGFSDFKVLSAMLKEIKKDFSLVINKFTDGHDFFEYAEENDIDIMGTIPFDKKIVEDYATGGKLKSNVNFENILMYIYGDKN